MKAPHPTAKLAADLTKQIEKMKFGSEPFALALRALGDVAWDLLKLRDVEWSVIGSKTEYVYRVNCYTATSAGIDRFYRTPDKPTAQVAAMSPYEKAVRKLAHKTRHQYLHLCNWICDQFDKALADPALNGRNVLRCLTGRARFEQNVRERVAELNVMMAGAQGKATELLKFTERHGEVHVYRDHLYRSEKEAHVALEADTKAVPPDHDLIVMQYEESFPATGGINEEAFTELTRYLNSTDHKNAVKEAEEMGGDPTLLSKHDRVIKMLVDAERALGSAPDPLPMGLHRLLGMSRSFLARLLKGKKVPYSKADVRAVLRKRLYELCPSRRPRKKSQQEKIASFVYPVDETQTAEKAVNSKWPCQSDCQCVRHG